MINYIQSVITEQWGWLLFEIAVIYGLLQLTSKRRRSRAKHAGTQPQTPFVPLVTEQKPAQHDAH